MSPFFPSSLSVEMFISTTEKQRVMTSQPHQPIAASVNRCVPNDDNHSSRLSAASIRKNAKGKKCGWQHQVHISTT